MPTLSLLLLSWGKVGTALGVVVPPDRVVVPTQHLPLSLAQPITATRVVVHRIGHGGALRAAPRAQLRLLFFTFFTTFTNMLTLQVFQHHVLVC